MTLIIKGNMEDAWDANRIGRFSVKDIFLKDAPTFLLKHVFSKILILRAEHMFGSQIMSYDGVSPLFEKLSPGLIPPEYNIHIETLEDNQVNVWATHRCEDDYQHSHLIITNQLRRIRF